MWMALSLRAEAQQLGAVRYFSRELVLTADTTLLDSLPIVAWDFQISSLDSVKISRSDFKLLSGRLVVAKKLLGLRVRVRYRVLGLQVFGVQRRYRAKRATSEARSVLAALDTEPPCFNSVHLDRSVIEKFKEQPQSI